MISGVELVIQIGAIGFAGQESVSQGGLQGLERRGSSLEGLKQFADLEIEGSVVAAVAIKGMLGADGAALEQHTGGVKMAGEAGVVDGDGVPLVPGVDVDTGVQEIAEAVDVAGAGGLENVAVRDLLQWE